MDLKQIKDLMSAMGRNGTKKLRIKQDNFELELEQEDKFSHLVQPQYFEAPEHIPSKSISNRTERGRADIPPSLTPPVEETKKEQVGKFVTSPMVGTFYTSPGPDEPPFVKPGDKITKDTVVCIIEAMKVMNEVKAGVEGVVIEPLVETGHPVEFGTKLYKIS